MCFDDDTHIIYEVLFDKTFLIVDQGQTKRSHIGQVTRLERDTDSDTANKGWSDPVQTGGEKAVL